MHALEADGKFWNYYCYRPLRFVYQVCLVTDDQIKEGISIGDEE